MELTKTIADKLGNVFINIGQGMILGSFLSGFLGDEKQPIVSALVFVLGASTVYIGLWFVGESEKKGV